MEKAASHAGNFMFNREKQVEHLRGMMKRPPLIISPYDAELYGHWWFEGPDFINYFTRKVAFDQNVFKLTTPTEYLRDFPTQQIIEPSASSWGNKGYWEVWLEGSNSWIYPHLHVAAQRMTELARNFKNGDHLTQRGSQTGRPRTPARAVQRLGVHHEDGDDGALRRETDEGPHPAFHAPLRADQRPITSTNPGSPPSSGATIFSPTSTTTTTRKPSCSESINSQPSAARTASRICSNRAASRIFRPSVPVMKKTSAASSSSVTITA